MASKPKSMLHHQGDGLVRLIPGRNGDQHRIRDRSRSKLVVVNLFGKILHELPRRCIDKLFTFCVKDILMSIRFGEGKSWNENGKQRP